MVRFGDSFQKKLWTECGAVLFPRVLVAVMPGFFSWLLEDRGVSIGDLDALTWWSNLNTFIPSIVGKHGLQAWKKQPRLKTQSLMTYVDIIQHLWILWREMWLPDFPRWGTCFVGTMCATFAVLQVRMLSNIWSWTSHGYVVKQPCFGSFFGFIPLWRSPFQVDFERNIR